MRHRRRLLRISLVALLSSSTAANVLPPTDVPVECAVICGPMVELTYACEASSSSSTNELRRRDEGEEVGSFFVNGESVKMEEDHGLGLRLRNEEEGVEVVSGLLWTTPSPVLVPAEESPATVTTTVTVTNAKSSSTTAVDSDTSDATSINSEDGTTTTTTTATASTQPHTSGTMTMTMTMTVGWSSTTGTGTGTGTGSTSTTSSTILPSMDPSADSVHKKAHEMDERDCVCANASFDVGVVAPLCASCIVQAGDGNSVMKDIMAQCNFTAAEYSPEKDSVVNNVVVRVSGAAGGGGGRSVVVVAWAVVGAVVMVGDIL